MNLINIGDRVRGRRYYTDADEQFVYIGEVVERCEKPAGVFKIEILEVEEGNRYNEGEYIKEDVGGLDNISA